MLDPLRKIGIFAHVVGRYVIGTSDDRLWNITRSRGIEDGVRRGERRRGKYVNRAISLVLFVVIIMASGDISAAEVNGAEICYFHGVEHPAPPVSGRREIRLDSVGAQSISGTAYATLEGDNTLEASGNALNGVLGGISGCLGGCLFGWMTTSKIGLWIGATVGTAAAGGYLGSRSDSGHVTAGAIIVIIAMLYGISEWTGLGGGD